LQNLRNTDTVKVLQIQHYNFTTITIHYELWIIIILYHTQKELFVP